MKMSPYGTWALMELDYAIYDGLEMILKVTKNAKNVYVNTLRCKMMMMDESVIVFSVICLRKSTLFFFKWS